MTCSSSSRWIARSGGEGWGLASSPFSGTEVPTRRFRLRQSKARLIAERNKHRSGRGACAKPSATWSFRKSSCNSSSATSSRSAILVSRECSRTPYSSSSRSRCDVVDSSRFSSLSTRINWQNDHAQPDSRKKSRKDGTGDRPPNFVEQPDLRYRTGTSCPMRANRLHRRLRLRASMLWSGLVCPRERRCKRRSLCRAGEALSDKQCQWVVTWHRLKLAV